MILIALLVANKNRALQGFTMDAETESLETEGAGYALGQLRGVLQGNGTPVSFTLSNPAPAGVTAFSGNTPSNDTAFEGNLTHQPLKTDGSADGYAQGLPPLTAAGSNPAITVPFAHSAVVLTARIPSDSTRAKQKHVGLFSGNYPYGLMAAGGNIRVQSVRSVSQYNCDPANLDSGVSNLMARIYAQGTIQVANYLNGRACSHQVAPAITVGGNGGVLYHNCTLLPPLPGDFNSQLTAFKAAAVTGLSNSLQKGFDDLHTALHHDFTAEKTAAFAAEFIGPGVLNNPTDPSGGASVSDVATFTSPGNTDYDTPGGTLTVGTSLRIPSGDSQELKFTHVIINGDLLLEQNSVLHLTGDLQMSSGTIRLDRNATLLVDGTTTTKGLSVAGGMTTTGAVEITSTFYGKGAVAINGGMTQATASWTGQSPSPNSNPYPSTLSLSWTAGPPPVTTVNPVWSNPLSLAYDGFLAADTIALTADHLDRYLGSVAAGSVTTTDVPGVFVLSDAGLTLGLNDDKATGLFVAQSAAFSVKTLVGAVWTTGGDIVATDYRYFPYYTHAYCHSAGGNTTVAAVEHHPTAYGKLP